MKMLPIYYTKSNTIFKCSENGETGWLLNSNLKTCQITELQWPIYLDFIFKV